jgi:uncharacterized protein YggE
MKQLPQLLVIFIGTVLAIFLLSLLSPTQRPAWAMATPATQALNNLTGEEAECSSGRTVQVSGSAAINVKPDRVLIELGVESVADTPQEVQAENDTAIKQITAALSNLGIPSKDIATDYYLIQPVYESNTPYRITSYRIDNVIGVTLTNVDQASDVLAAALQAGANQVQNVQFYTSELRRYRDQARELAMKAASEKAQALAGAGGAQAGCLLQINENSWSHYNGYWWGGRDRAMWSQNVVQNAAPSEPASEETETPISSGQIVVRAEVNATFSLN